MHRYQIGFLSIALIALSGCGTVQNLTELTWGLPRYLGSDDCTPFGGVIRSYTGANMSCGWGTEGVTAGIEAVGQGELAVGLEYIGLGLVLTSVGLVATADMPLSLAGDILTLPIAYARSKEHPWANWWGEQSKGNPKNRLPMSDDSGEKSREGSNPPN